MNTDLNKCVYVSFLVIFVIIFNEHKSDANYCEEQITEYGQMNKNLNGMEAFIHAYHNFTSNYIEDKKKYILENYFENHLAQVVKTQTLDDWADDPKQWMKENYRYSSITSFRGQDTTFKSAKKTAYFYTSESDFEEDVNKGYFKYILRKLLTLVPNLNLQGPLKFCEKYTAQIRGTQRITYDGDSRSTFIDIYHSLHSGVYDSESDILRQYLQDLFDAIVPSNVHDLIDNPVKWCVLNYKEESDFVEYDTKVMICQYETLTSVFRNDLDNARSAISRAYFELTESELRIDNLKGYYEYMLEKILSFDFDKAENPKTFCETHF